MLTVSNAPNIYEDQPCIEGIIVEAFGSTDFSCFHDEYGNDLKI